MNKDKLMLYRLHPRILELKFISLHTMFTMEYGVEKATNMFKMLCDVGRMNWTILSSVFNRKDLITALASRNRIRYRQELIFMGMCYGESRITVGKKYLNLSRRMMYEYFNNSLDPKVFITEQWLDGLDYNVVVAGVDSYRLELERFIEFVNNLGAVIGYVPLAKV